MAARLERQARARAQQAHFDAQAREIAAAKFKEEMRLESHARRIQKESHRRLEETKRKSHANQRALLAARLQREDAIRATIRQQQQDVDAVQQATKEAQTQPKPKQEEEELAARYGAIDDIGKRAFAILVDLGMVTINPDPRSSDYNDSHDDEFVE